MRKLFAWLGIATLFVLTSTAHAQNDVLKPYVVLILDTSGSMVCTNSTCGNPTGSGPPSCGGVDNKLNHAKCAINNIVNSYGDMVFALGRFRTTLGGTTTMGTFPSGCCEAGPGISGTNGCGAGPACGAATTATGVMLQLLTGLVDGNNLAAASYTNFTANSCTTGGTDPEIWDAPGACVGGGGLGDACGGATPLDGVLRGSKLYWQGNQATDGTVLWPQNQAGYDPINRDPSSAVFLPKMGETTCNPNTSTCNSAGNCTGANCCCVTQCRPYVTILLTDGSETCSGDPPTAAAALLTTTPRSDQINIQSIMRSNNVVTVTFAAAHPFVVGDVVVVTGVSNPTFNSGGTQPPTFTITAVTTMAPFTITYAQTGANTTSSMGNVRHAASTFQYRIETKPIGFGITPGDPNIEAIAHAGGALDLPNVDEGYYAQNEADIELAMSQILADSVRAESCNERDDDCDTRVDEDFPDKGKPCMVGVGECVATGVFVCDNTGTKCNATPGTGTPEICDQKDNDCNGLVDDGITCTSCVPTGEICNNRDEDCDGRIDEGLTRACGTGTCTGVETCTAGTWGGCTAQQPTTELCNGADDDCNGVCDGLSNGCSEVGGACNPNVASSCPATNSPGDPGHYTGPDTAETSCSDAIDNDLDGLINDGCPTVAGTAETACNNAADDDNDGAVNDGCPVPSLPIPQNICHPGTKTCAVLCNMNGNSFGACSGEVKPLATDPCDGLDNDCDNKIDEGFVPQDCSTNCGVGTTQCVNGQVTCNSTPATDDTTCNNVDDDCDGQIDEDWTCANPINGMCPCGTGLVCDGLEKCVNGAVVCQGTPVGNETCNCQDEDCDTRVDEGTVCPQGSTCTNCQCAFPCAQSEFPCPLGKKCDTSQGPPGYCVNDPCFNISCPPVNGHAQTCIPKPNFPNEPQCVDTCTTVTCNSPLICYQPTGECRPDDCTTFPERCTGTQVCVNGQCISNPCDGVTCPGDKYCLGGTCVSSCADVMCPAGQRCRQGMCETDPCGKQCPFGQQCNDATGECIEDPCKFRNCPQGQWCNPNDGQCEDDPCVANAIECPHEGEVCRGGSCYDPDDLRPDAAGEAHVTVGGGGGCSTTSGGSSLLLGLALLLVRRRRRVPGARQGGLQ
ncbi:MAG TPA: MopE-related protein [Kofleriaceae bacterium]|nr:MopE-related protein [Kofleriaceae bacterium]